MDLAPLPPSKHADLKHLEEIGERLAKITMPVSRDEAVLLASGFGPDDCYGLAWTLVHLIESAPGGAPLDALIGTDNEWIALLRTRHNNRNS